MKTTYISLFFIILILLSIIVLNFIDIPAPSIVIEETYDLDIK